MEARQFFGIDPLYILNVRAILDGGQAANIDAGDGYLRATIGVSLDYYQEHPEHIRRDMAHEVGHLMGNEILSLISRFPDGWADQSTPHGGLFRDAIETLTVRLERLFLRERPE